MLETLKKIFSQKRNRNIFFVLNFFSLLFYFLFVNFISSYQILLVPFFNVGEKVNFFISALFDDTFLKSKEVLFLVILFILSTSLLFLLIYILFSETNKIHKTKSIFGLLGLFLSVLGFSCVSCGIGLLASILSLLGLSSLSLYFPLHGLEFGFLGIIILNITNYLLLKRIKNPFVC